MDARPKHTGAAVSQAGVNPSTGHPTGWGFDHAGVNASGRHLTSMVASFGRGDQGAREGAPNPFSLSETGRRV